MASQLGAAGTKAGAVTTLALRRADRPTAYRTTGPSLTVTSVKRPAPRALRLRDRRTAARETGGGRGGLLSEVGGRAGSDLIDKQHSLSAGGVPRLHALLFLLQGQGSPVPPSSSPWDDAGPPWGASHGANGGSPSSWRDAHGNCCWNRTTDMGAHASDARAPHDETDLLPVPWWPPRRPGVSPPDRQGDRGPLSMRFLLLVLLPQGGVVWALGAF